MPKGAAVEGAGRQLLAVDVGNTSIKAGLFVGEGLAWTVRCPTSEPEQLVGLLREKSGGELPSGLVAGVASVVLRLAEVVEELLKGGGVAEVIVLGRDRRIPIENLTQKPEQVGQDRLLAALAATTIAELPLVVVDAGTAITVDGVDEDGSFMGGAILPGVEMMAEALHRSTSALPRIQVKDSQLTIGTDTESAILAGVLASAMGGANHAVNMLLFDCELGSSAPVVVTGGHGTLVASGIDSPEVSMVPDLVLIGIRVACEG